MTADYSTQILATQAAARSSGLGLTPTTVTYGCSFSRIGTGIYALILPTGEGVVDEQSFVQATNTGPGFAYLVCSDQDQYTKVITAYSTGGVATDTGISVSVRRATVDPY